MRSSSRSPRPLPAPGLPSRPWTFVALACILASMACGGATQRTAAEDAPKPAAASPTPSPPSQSTASAGLTTLTGVYTMDQATRGRTVFLGMCRDCHTPEEQSGDKFAKRWLGRALGDMYEYLITEMPKNDPGSLSPDEYADVMAYMLRIDAMPVGTRGLAADGAAREKSERARETPDAPR